MGRAPGGSAPAALTSDYLEGDDDYDDGGYDSDEGGRGRHYDEEEEVRGAGGLEGGGRKEGNQIWHLDGEVRGGRMHCNDDQARGVVLRRGGRLWGHSPLLMLAGEGSEKGLVTHECSALFLLLEVPVNEEGV
jgi:hypothetical protein